jgi:hypothetical protein
VNSGFAVPMQTWAVEWAAGDQFGRQDATPRDHAWEQTFVRPGCAALIARELLLQKCDGAWPGVSERGRIASNFLEQHE